MAATLDKEILDKSATKNIACYTSFGCQIKPKFKQIVHFDLSVWF